MSKNGKIGSLEDRIRSLCASVVKSGDEDDLQSMCAALRSMLSQHIELVRDQVRELKVKEIELKRKVQ